MGIRPAALFIALFLLWIMLAGRLEWSVTILGLVLCSVILKLTWRVFFATLPPHRSLLPKRGFFQRVISGLGYVPVFFISLFKATAQVALISLSPRIDIRPGIVKIDSRLRSKTALVILANNITITPGTLTVDADMSRHDLFVHCLDLQTLEECRVCSEIQRIEERLGSFLE